MIRRELCFLAIPFVLAGCDSENINVLGIGEKCNMNSVCESHNCVEMVCMPPGATTAKTANGDKCQSGTECASSYCVSGLCSLTPGSDEPSASTTDQKVANGGTCDNGSGCISGHCIEYVCQETANDAKKGNGRGCIRNIDCASGHCVQRVCRETGDDVQTKLADSKPCSSDNQCESNHCHENTACRPVNWDSSQGLDLSESCTSNNICESSLCVGNQCAASGDGQLSSNHTGLGKKTVGANCTQNAECETGLCYENQCSDQCAIVGCVEAYYVCRAGRCIPVETFGTDCYSDMDCSKGYYCCNGFCTTNKCEVGISCEGNVNCEHGCNTRNYCRCETHTECGKNYYCGNDGSWGQLCYPVKMVNASCKSTAECMDGLFCKTVSSYTGDGVCTKKYENDMGCSGHEECASGRCEIDQNGEADEYCNGYSCSCKPAAPNGRHCQIDSNCESGYCKPDQSICADKISD